MNAKVEILTINPQLAKKFLENRLEGQRHVRPTQVNRLTQEIKHGSFRLTSDALVFIEGKLANGQHRLSAVVESGVECPFLVLTTDDHEIYKVIDCGITRQVCDMLGNISYNKLIPTVSRMVINYDRKVMRYYGVSTASPNIATRSEILEYSRKHMDELTELIMFASKLYSRARILSPAVAAAFMHIAMRNSKGKEPYDFIRSVYTGNTNDSGSDFRDAMIKIMGSRTKQDQTYKFGLLIKAWNSYKNGTRPSRLKITEEEDFPEI